MLIVTLCVAVVALLGTADCKPVFHGRCPGGWVQYGRSCYRVMWTSRTWAQAERNCLAHGANLASVHRSGEYRFLQRLTHTSAWLGGYDATQEGWWFWSDGSRMSYQTWARGEPNNSHRHGAHRGQNCLVMNHGGRWGRWDDRACRDRNPSICVGKIH